ncbi:MAG: type II toxin-antitoxin system RelE/ParE family toxin [Deltaproteobacteria bacterium]|nr:type II toxin-antitoxin system RelE/ParE family toxin [Deltaproteobacteria bacterium]
MSEIIWLPEAVKDMARLFDFLKGRNKGAAQKAAKLIKSGAALLQGQPLIGRLMDDSEDSRELFLPFGQSAYVLRYRLDGERVVVVRVWHGRELRDES